MAARPTALVTGASFGIGECYARRLAERGNDLVVVARDAVRLQALADELRAQYGTETEVLVADLLDGQARGQVEARLEDGERPVDTLINNAGFGTHGTFHQLDREGESREIELNVHALVRLTHAALGPMVARGRGGILNVSSVASYQPTPNMATYGATKAFVTSFTQAVHEEVRGTGVRVSVQCPGFTRTRFSDVANATDAAATVPGFLWQSADQVACEGLDGLERGRAVIVPGWPNKVLTTTTSVLPDAVVRRAARFIMR